MTEYATRHVSPEDFQKLGYLQELNRQFLHPLGLALAVSRHEDGTTTLGPILTDDDPEGWRFGEDQMDDEFIDKAGRVAERWLAFAPRRLAALGYVVQPRSDGRGSQ